MASLLGKLRTIAIHVSTKSAFVLICAICLSGTLMVDDDVPFVLPSLSLMTFTSDMTSPWDNQSKYLIEFHWFLNALDFTYPQAPKDWQKAGMIYNINGLTPEDSLTFPLHMISTARRLDLSPHTYRCLEGVRPGDQVLASTCSSAFFEALAERQGAHSMRFGTGWALLAYYVALVFLWAKTAKGLAVATGAMAAAAAWCTWLIFSASQHLYDIRGTYVEVGLLFITLSWTLAGMGAVAWALTALKEWEMSRATADTPKKTDADVTAYKDDVES